MARLPVHSAEFYRASERWVDECLRGDGSLFTPGRAVWTEANAREAFEHFVGQPDEGSDTFLVKLEGQLRGATDGAIQLFGELLFAHLLISKTVGAARKRENIETVLSFMAKPVQIPPDLDPTLGSGILNPGTYFNTRRDGQIAFLIEFVCALKRADAAAREECLSQPLALRAFVDDLPDRQGALQREALLYMVFPDYFEPIVQRDHKAQIVKAFSDQVSDPDAGVDQQLIEIRSAVEDRFGPGFHWYQPEIRPLWSVSKQPPARGGSRWDQFIYWAGRFFELPEFDTLERDYKFVIAGRVESLSGALERSGDWQPALADVFKKPNNLVFHIQASQFKDWCAEHPTEARGALERLLDPAIEAAVAIDQFLESLPDSVASGARLNIASVVLMGVDPTQFPPYRTRPFNRAYKLTGYPRPDGGSIGSQYAHHLTFLDEICNQASSRGVKLRDRLDAQSVLWMIARHGPPPEWSDSDKAAFLAYRGGDVEPEEADEPDEQSDLRVLAKRLHLEPDDWLERAEKLVRDKGQLIFFGPPGTGKTFVAREFAHYLAGDRGSVEVVQFHPSYAYEDFVEGYRPKEINGQPGFGLAPGPLRRIAKRAAEDRSATHVLVIDEINRGNLPKVFGELYYLLEYRGSPVNLQYSAEEFTLPKDNLLIIGTMNSADRSITAMDSALRRRFYYLPFFPSRPPVDGLLRRWLRNKHPELVWVADAVDAVNRSLPNEDAALGPSHFLREDLDEEWVSLIWEHAVMPFVEDQFFGRPERWSEFELERVRRRIAETELSIDADSRVNDDDANDQPA